MKWVSAKNVLVVKKNLDRRHKFFISRKLNHLGLEQFDLENRGCGEAISVEKGVFDRLRQAVVKFANGYQKSLGFIGDTGVKYSLDLVIKQTKVLVISVSDFSHQDEKSLSIEIQFWSEFIKLLYHSKLDHPSEALDLIIAYHSLYQFTFESGAESITSGLILRRDILCQDMPYQPIAPGREQVVSKKSSGKSRTGKGTPSGKKTVNSFQPRLGERHSQNRQDIDITTLFDNSAHKIAPKSPRAAESIRGAGQQNRTAFMLPILASDIKSFQQSRITCSFDQDHIQDFRKNFLQDRSSEFYLGFEILSAVYKKASGLRAFKFPLYFVKVNIEESGRDVFLSFQHGGAFFLNHLALANLVDTFSPGENSEESLSRFFNTLLSQKLKIHQSYDRVRLTRKFPLDEAVFEETRKCLLGFKDENGLGGILSHLQILGIEVDLDAAYLYKAPRRMSPLNTALNSDLKKIQKLAHNYPKDFYQSILGRFLVPECYVNHQHKKNGPNPHAYPGHPSRAMKHLTTQLQQNDLMLLEGPPGTGKTFSIRNLLIDAVVSGKKILIVSDQAAAIEALKEKMIEYMSSHGGQKSNIEYVKHIWNLSIKYVDAICDDGHKIEDWINTLNNLLCIEDVPQKQWPEYDDKTFIKLNEVDERIKNFENHITSVMKKSFGSDEGGQPKVARKNHHPSSQNAIDDMLEFIHLVNTALASQHNTSVLDMFICHRRLLFQQDFKLCLNLLRLDSDLDSHMAELKYHSEALKRILKFKPRSYKSFIKHMGSYKGDLLRSLDRFFQKTFPAHQSLSSKVWSWMKSFFQHPPLKLSRLYFDCIENQIKIVLMLKNSPEIFQRYLKDIHNSLIEKSQDSVPLSLEILQHAIEQKQRQASDSRTSQYPTVQQSLEEISRLYKVRDEIIYQGFMGRLGQIIKGAYQDVHGPGTSLNTTIANLLGQLKSFARIDQGESTLHELQDALLQAFPIWVCRKQATSFLFNTEQQIFDLVIVDEATQCRVDDAMPLLFRAKKLLVVGDEKQTVLAKNSTIDDYIFNSFSLHDILRGSQAVAMKGGGSHLFGLIRGIKQGAVILDEHYRCPPEIISYSNKYVYHNELKPMKWQPSPVLSSVYVDDSECQYNSGGRKDGGKYKGIETVMVDRFLDYILKTIPVIEKELGRKLDLASDVAICYFLLKNDVYFNDVKASFLERAARGEDILMGAGAALQGKERNYIFYYWDMNRSNMMAFRQGDDPDKRKGELNVLMSRPKKRAYHYVHRDFHKLNHSSATIADFLWRTYQAQKATTIKKDFTLRRQEPGSDFFPWSRSSGGLMLGLLQAQLPQGALSKRSMSFDFGVVVGDPQQRIDIVLSRRRQGEVPRLALVDLAGFSGRQEVGAEIVDYYFQLHRAEPRLKPCFIFIHELALSHSRSFGDLTEKLEKLKKAG